MNDLQTSLFDYAGLPSVEAVEIRAAAERIKVRLKRTAEDIIEIGRDLIAVKARLPHGQFLPWLKTEFEFSESSANKFMQVAEKFGAKSVNFTDLKPAILYALAAPSTPETVRAEVIERAEAGEKITLAEVEQLKREAAQAAELKSRNTALNLTIMELAKEGDALKAKLEARPEPTVIEKVVERTVEVIPADYDALKTKAAKLGELKDDLAAMRFRPGGRRPILSTPISVFARQENHLPAQPARQGFFTGFPTHQVLDSWWTATALRGCKEIPRLIARYQGEEPAPALW